MKPFKNSITDWELVDGRIRGQVRFAQHSAGADSGETITTSSVERIYFDDGKRFAETKNSLYILED